MRGRWQANSLRPAGSGLPGSFLLKVMASLPETPLLPVPTVSHSILSVPSNLDSCLQCPAAAPFRFAQITVIHFYHIAT
jgi:hypothetical protein